MENNNHNRKQDIAIVRLDERLENLERRFEVFISNDFKHLRDKVDSIEEKIMYGFIIMIAVTLILQIILKLF